MGKHRHEIRDPIHVFIYLDSNERKVLDSRPFQRLRYIHQLALTYLVYPGATHKRFEHSLGVMELASRVFDVITAESNYHEAIREIIPPKDEMAYWRLVLRMAALCHDIGHLPFSHAAEKELLPNGRTHEDFTIDLIESKEMCQIWENMRPPLKSSDIAKLAVGQKKYKAATFSNWEAILAEIIIGDAFGVDRMDYLLRDSLHAGVAYGRFDHYRLIDTLRILPKSYEESDEPLLGIELGGIYSAEALILARYFMFSQLYYHDVRVIYDIHLKDFLVSWLESGKFSTDLNRHLDITDNEVLTALNRAAKDTGHPGHDPARRIMGREHFKLIYQHNPRDVEINPDAGKAIYDAACEKFGESEVRHYSKTQKGGGPNFPVLIDDRGIESSLKLSSILKDMRPLKIDYVYISPEKFDNAVIWLRDSRSEIITMEGGANDE